MTQHAAKGIPDRRIKGDPLKLPLNYPLTFVEQLHNAKRAGKHIDFRMGTPSTGMLSWAVPKGLPEKIGEKRLAITQPIHSWDYNDFEGTIGKGYGSGTVKQKDKGQLILVDKRPGMFKFTRTDRRNPPIYTMVQTPNDNWIIFIQKEGDADSILHYDKERFRNISPSTVDAIMGKGTIATPKLDGAGALAHIRKHGIDVYSIRKDKDGKLIRYTDHIGNLRGLKVPPNLVGKVLRGEVIATKDNKVLPPQEIGGLLNSNLDKVLAKRNEGVKLHLAALAYLQNNKEIYDPAKVNEIVEQLKTPAITAVPTYTSAEQTKAELQKMREGSHPLTSEGVVVYPKDGRPLKAKLFEEDDVTIEDIFPSKNDDRAGGFTYRLPLGGTGRVGSGFDFSTLRDMLENPDKYKNRIARIRSMGQYPSGAYRSPSFIALHEG